MASWFSNFFYFIFDNPLIFITLVVGTLAILGILAFELENRKQEEHKTEPIVPLSIKYGFVPSTKGLNS